jgi:hypothetical protein
MLAGEKELLTNSVTMQRSHLKRREIDFWIFTINDGSTASLDKRNTFVYTQTYLQ